MNFIVQKTINSVSNSSDFDLNILILINNHQKDIKTNLTFEFICKSCKHSSPFMMLDVQIVTLF